MISRRSIETLIDLVENKLSQIISVDRDNMKEFKTLQSCADELQAMHAIEHVYAGSLVDS